MKKIILIVITVVVALLVYINVNAETDEIIIPEAAIRVRVIANSNTIQDQSMKMKVKEYIEKTISPKLIDVESIEEARTIINNELEQLNQEIEVLFQNNNYNQEFLIHFGDNYFPEKDYKGVHYEAGAYQSLVVTIGEGEGDNWWCVLFPPLCLLEANDNDTSDVEYQFFVTKMLEKIF
ncbi:MAG: stage II sporulation protein R [Erysipelotrichaceae bacterium]|nr:stage II sporulation protein R [Erysipelotrichaceae bacterium]